jgi:hypothetical protein
MLTFSFYIFLDLADIQPLRIKSTKILDIYVVFPIAATYLAHLNVVEFTMITVRVDVYY